MPRIITRILFALLICALPSLGSAAEQAPQAAEAKPAAPTPTDAPTPAPQATLPAATTEAPKPQQLHIGYIDIVRISTESSLGKASAAQAKQKQEKLQAQITEKRKQLDRQKKALETQFASLSPAQRDAKAKEFQKKVESFQKFGMNAEKEMQTLQQGLGKSFNEAVQQAATEYGTANSLALVILKREILYQAGSVETRDVSEGVIKLMNEKWVKKK